MPDIKEKLVELLTDKIPGCDNELRYVDDERVERLADHLIANGVTIQDDDETIPKHDMEIILHEVAERAKPKWISVEERLPTKDDADVHGCVLAINKHTAHVYWEWDSIARFKEDFIWWMPFPELPMEVANEH